MSVRGPRSQERQSDSTDEWGHRDWGNGLVCAYNRDEVNVWIMYDPDEDTVELSDWQ